MRICPFIGALFLLCIACAQPCAAEQLYTIGDLNVAVWKPAHEPGKYPVIIFSHGFHGCATQSKFLMDALAKDGFIVFAPNHKDAACAHSKARWIDPPNVPFGNPEEWTQDSFRDRGDDIRRLIDAIKTDNRFRDLIDWDRLGLAGHSLGGYTVLALGGAWADWKLPGVKAILALSPYSQPFIRHSTLSDLDAPVMYQGGTRDLGITPSLRNSDGAYDMSPPPKYFVEFVRAGHFAWTNMPSPAHDNIEVYSVAFLDHYVKNKAADPVLTENLRGVTNFRYDSELGDSAHGKASGTDDEPSDQ